MKNIFLVLLTVCILSAACTQDKTGKAASEARVNVALRSFSDTAKLDTFKIILNGDQPKNMELVFTITTSSGKPIYKKIIAAKLLLDNYKDNVDLGKKKKQIQFIKDELKLFLDEENFLEPAVTENEQADKNSPDKAFFSELKQSGVNGFKYRLGMDSFVYIAWSDSTGTVKPYYECCK